MAAQTTSQQQDSIWADEDTAKFLRLRVKTFYNTDYFERIVLPLLDIPQDGRALDVGCGYGGLSLLLAGLRPDLQITGVDVEASALDSATETAAQDGLENVTFEHGDAHALKYEDGQFDAVLCQTVLTHVRDAEAVVRQMARVLNRGGVFLAAEYANSGAWTAYDSVSDSRRDEAWYQKYFRSTRLFMKGKKALGRGDDRLGVRVPMLATASGLDVFDFRLNDRALHVIPPYKYPKQSDYLELLGAVYASDPDQKALERHVEILRAAGGTEEDARWRFNELNDPAVGQAIERRDLTMLSAFRLYLTFARKPAA